MIWNGLDSISIQENNLYSLNFEISSDCACKNLVRFHFNIVYYSRTINLNNNKKVCNLIIQSILNIYNNIIECDNSSVLL